MEPMRLSSTEEDTSSAVVLIDGKRIYMCCRWPMKRLAAPGITAAPPAPRAPDRFVSDVIIKISGLDPDPCTTETQQEKKVVTVACTCKAPARLSSQRTCV